MATYISNIDITFLVNDVTVNAVDCGGGKYKIVTDDVDVISVIEGMPEFKHGFIFKMPTRTPVSPSPADPASKVKNAKQAMEWLVRNKGEKRGVYSKEQIRALAEKHGVEFPNWQ